MLPKQKRLNRRAFLKVLEESKTFHTPFFTIRMRPNEGAHFSVVISKKIAKTATKRNYLRRRLYNLLSTLPLKGDFIIFVKKPLENKDILENTLLELKQFLKNK